MHIKASQRLWNRKWLFWRYASVLHYLGRIIYLCKINAKSTHQRIESFWSRLKKHKLNWWINFFNHMIGTNLHKISSAIHGEVFVFSVIPIIQTDLNEFMRTWNCRIIRKSTEHQEEFPKCCLIYQLLLDFLNKVLMSNKEIYRLTKRPSLLLEIRLILIQKYMSCQHLIRNITNWEFLKWEFKS